MHRFDKILAEQGAPVLAGMKTANLVTCQVSDFPNFHEVLADYDRAFAKKGIRFELLCACRHRYLVLVHRPARLLDDLANTQALPILRTYGYPLRRGLSALIAHLRQRMQEEKSFPHEIGLFLGYPPLDVRAFIEKGGRDSKLTGYWKVYGDPVTAQALFTRYDRCREAARMQIARGITMKELFSVA